MTYSRVLLQLQVLWGACGYEGAQSSSRASRVKVVSQIGLSGSRNCWTPDLSVSSVSRLLMSAASSNQPLINSALMFTNI